MLISSSVLFILGLYYSLDTGFKCAIETNLTLTFTCMLTHPHMMENKKY